MQDDDHEVMLAAEYDSSAEAFARGAHAIYARLAVPLVRAAAAQAGERVLDLATGTGSVGTQLAGNVVGLDVSAAQLRFNPLPDKRLGTAEHMPFADSTFDVVVCGFGINHFARPVAALGEIRRVLVAGGRVALSTWLRPQPEYIPKAIVLASLKRRTGRARTLASEVVDALTDRVGSVDSLAGLLSEAGFTAVRATVAEVVVPWTGSDAFIDYRLAMLGAGGMLSPEAERELRREVDEELGGLSPAQLHWLPQVLVATASLPDA